MWFPVSAEATGWVLRHSPHRGATLLVHLAVADSVNDQYGNRFWMAKGNLAAKVRMNRKTAIGAVAELVDGGFLEVLSARHGEVVEYRFLFPDAPVVYEGRGVARDHTPLSTDATGGVAPRHTNPREPKKKTKSSSFSTAVDPYADQQAARDREHERNAQAAAEPRPDVTDRDTSLDELRKIRAAHKARRRVTA